MTEYGGLLPRRTMPSFAGDDQPGGKGLKLGTVLRECCGYLLHEVIYQRQAAGHHRHADVFSTMLETLQTAFERNTVSKVAYSVTYMVMIVLAVNSFNVAIGYAKDAIGR